MSRYLPIFNTFNPAFEVWEKKPPTDAERLKYYQQYNSLFPPKIKVGEKPLIKIDNYYDAANLVANMDGYNYPIDNHVEDILDNNIRLGELKLWDIYMGEKLPDILMKHQIEHDYIYINNKSREVDEAINRFNCCLSEGQYLFHGGLLPFDKNNLLKTQKPLSTSFLPHLSLVEAMNGNKIYENKSICLYLLKAVNPKTKVYFYKAHLSHEREVLFASGATLIKKSETYIREQKFESSRWCSDRPPITIPIYVAEVEIS